MAREMGRALGAAPEEQVECKPVGRAMVVHRRGRMSPAAQSLAWSIAEDPDNDVVVLDIPHNCPVWMWEAVAKSLPKRRRGLRLVVGERSHEMTAMTGQWLSERLRRTVFAPDGMVVRGAAGTLFVHSGRESGWVRFTPGKPPRWESKRFPRPRWETAAVDHPWPTSSGGVAEPVPGGVWLRSVHTAPRMQDHRRTLAQSMLVRRDRMSVVLGCPGGVPLSLDDIARLWVNVPPEARWDIRFVRFGPVDLPDGVSLGQAIADLVDQPVVVSQGMPVEGVDGSVVRIVHPSGALGWMPFVRELGFNPRRMTGGVASLPTVLDHRTPLEGLPEIAPGVFQYTPDAVLEVVQGGLWMRSPDGAVSPDTVRGTPLDPSHFWFVYDCQNEAVSARMRTLAQDVMARLSADVQPVCRLLPTTSLELGAVRRTAERLGSAGGAEFNGPLRHGSYADVPAPVDLVWAEESAVPEPDAAEVVTASAGGEGEFGGEGESEDGAATGDAATTGNAAAAGDVAAAQDAAVVREVQPPEQSATAAAEGSPAAETSAAAEVSATVEGRAAAGSATEGIADRLVGQESAPVPPSPPHPAPLPQPPPLAAAAGTVRLESSLDYDDVLRELGLGDDAVEEPEPGDEPPAVEPEVVERRPAEVRAQPEPKAEAAALLPAVGIEKERAWLRRTLSRQFDHLSTSAARLLSEQPGLRAHGQDQDVVTDLVALRLYLSEEGEALDEALHTATVGPHVPFARCVVAGLRRMGTHRGRVSLRAQVEPEHLDWYRDTPSFSDWGFVNAVPWGAGDWPGNCDIEIWSLSGRRTTGLEPPGSGLAERVVFLPGTRFSLLDLVRDDEGAHRIVLRECSAAETGGGDLAAEASQRYEQLARAGLDRAATATAGPTPSASALARLSALPGLVVAR
ncbi:hypothetical protein ACFWN2_07470 [Lentzea sp. NPDC058436]|uniref:hypothetical protein n=1 Tax=Lentzea sp. NPDC058436 TaxID=3346499 RepID=UPI003660C4D9